MNIQLNLDKDFEEKIKKLKRKYGEKFEYLNGFHNNNLNFTEFIDSFTKTNTLADVTIDGNANANTKDVSSLVCDMVKPHTKLLGFNKVYYEIKKKYGKDTADDWLEAEWIGVFYMHNASDISLKPYCFSGDTKILTKDGIKSLKELEGKVVETLNKNGGWEESLVNNFGKQKVKLLTLERYGVKKQIKVTGNHKWFIKTKKGLDVVSTDNLQIGMKIPFNTSGTWYKVNPSPFGVAHGFFTGDGDKGKKLRANFCGDKVALLPYFTPSVIGGTEKEYTTLGSPNYFRELPRLDESASYLYGWLSGYFSADGCVDENGRCTIASTELKNIEHVRNVLCVLGMPVNEIRSQSRVTNYSNGEVSTIYVLSLSVEYLKSDFFIRPIHKERYKFTSNKERKNRSWIVREVCDLGEEIDVYCAVCPKTQSFTLDNNILTHNCFAFDLENVVTKGLFFNDGMPSKPAKHLSTYNEHVLQFVSYCSKLISGAVGLPNYLLYSYYFWKKDVENNYLGCREQAEKYRDQYFQSFIYNMNQTLLRVNQSAFTNVSIFDRNYYMELFGGKKFPDGTLMYKDCDDFIEYQKAFMRVIAKVRGEQYFTFPVLTYSLLFKDGKFVDENFAKWCITHNCIWYDANIYNSKSTDTISSCCRITNNTKEIEPFINSIGGTSLSVGSVVVNTLNLRRIALLSDKNENHYMNRLEYYSKLSIKAMDCVRDIIKRNVEKGLLPIYKYDLIQMDKQFNTFGITAMYEAVREFGYIETDEFGNKCYTEDGIKFSSKIFDFLNEYRKSVPVDYPINIESVPGERANVILCEKDNEIFGNEFNDWIYSNQWIPLMEKCTITEKIRLSKILDNKCGGGVIAHINIEKPFATPEQAWEMANEMARNDVIYWAFNSKQSIDINGHQFYGEICPKCGEKKCDEISRIVGFLVPTSNYSKERNKEFSFRKYFDINER